MAKILIIEDQTVIIKLLKTRFKAVGHEVISAEDGHAGLEMVKKDMPDLIITDLAMPKMTGNTVIRILKKSDAFKHIPIIMLSAFIRGTEKDAVEVPADEYIAKPFSAEALIGKVQELLAKAKKNSP